MTNKEIFDDFKSKYRIVVTIKNLWEIGGENDLFTRD